MHRPHLSTGAWLFCEIVVAALIAPAGVYAAVNSRVAIGNLNDDVTANVTQQHQLLTTVIAPANLLTIGGSVTTNACKVIYRPPAGKALMLMNLTISLGTGTAGHEAKALVSDNFCILSYDFVDTSQAHDTEQRVYPAGLPLPALALESAGSPAFIAAVGYLIPASSVP